MPRVMKMVVLTLAAALGTAACVGKGRNAPVPQAPATVRVQNQAFIDVDIYVLYSGTRARLGTVTANSTAVFRIPDTIVGMGREVQFLADPIGSNRQGRSFNVYARPGEEVPLTIPPSFAQ